MRKYKSERQHQLVSKLHTVLANTVAESVNHRNVPEDRQYVSELMNRLANVLSDNHPDMLSEKEMQECNRIWSTHEIYA